MSFDESHGYFSMSEFYAALCLGPQRSGFSLINLPSDSSTSTGVHRIVHKTEKLRFLVFAINFTFAWFAIMMLSPRLASASGVCPFPDDFYCAIENRCFSKSWVCDSQNDCPDGSDEVDCGAKQCHPGQFRCKSGQCVLGITQCDGFDDCTDKSDEENCPTQAPRPGCKSSEFKCGSGECIPLQKKCDAIFDCQDESDENICDHKNQTVVCNDQEFRCNNKLECVPKRWLCDGDDDCFDGSDEKDCKPGKCPDGHFTCANTVNLTTPKCIVQHYVCDGEKDCTDNSDEKNCDPKPGRCQSPSDFYCGYDDLCIHQDWVCDGRADCMNGRDERNCSSCPKDEHQCDGNVCIPPAQMCNGFYDCFDKTDEQNCSRKNHSAKKRCNPHTEFTCKDGECISLSKVCNGKKDCQNNEDEHMKVCAANNSLNVTKSPCENVTCLHGKCIETPINMGYFCRCDPGFRLANGSDTICEDINECHETVGACSQLCVNTKGSFHCECDLDNYVVDLNDKTACHAVTRKGKSLAQAWYAIHGSLRAFTFDKGDYMSLTDSVTSIDSFVYNYNKTSVIWSEPHTGKITLSDLKKPGQSQLLVDEFDSPVLVMLAFDYHTSNLYYSKSYHEWSRRGGVYVINIEDTSKHYTLFNDTQFIQSLVVNPQNGHMFWIEYKSNTRTSALVKASMDGSERKTLVEEGLDTGHFLAVAIDEPASKVYFARANTREILVLHNNRRFGTTPKVLMRDESVHSIWAMQVFEDKLLFINRSKLILSTNKRKATPITRYMYSPHEVLALQMYHPVLQPPLAFQDYCEANCPLCLRTSSGTKHYRCVLQSELEASSPAHAASAVGENIGTPGETSQTAPPLKTYLHSTRNADEFAAAKKRMNEEQTNKKHHGKIAGITIAVIIGIALVALLVLAVVFRRRLPEITINVITLNQKRNMPFKRMTELDAENNRELNEIVKGNNVKHCFHTAQDDIADDPHGSDLSRLIG